MKGLCPQPPILRRRNNHIPYDIAFNILAKLPVKSVIRFRCVCKSWDSSITTPYFISTHLNHNNNNKDRDNGYVIHKPSSPSTPNSPICTVAFDHTDRSLSTGDNDIYLWNPSIRKFKKLPDTCLGKWFAYIKEENCRRVIIMAFDVNSEKFKKLALPDDCFHGRSLHRCLALFKGKLAFIKCGRNEQRDFQFSIWVMREYGVVESWDKLFVLPFQRVAYCNAFTEYGSLLARCVTRVKNRGSKFVLIDTETLHEKDPGIRCTSFVANFIESLVLLDGANVEAY
nr:putative F-box protein At5g50220 [Quercus suber]